jgi:hypothetical protein
MRDYINRAMKRRVRANEIFWAIDGFCITSLSLRCIAYWMTRIEAIDQSNGA